MKAPAAAPIDQAPDGEEDEAKQQAEYAAADGATSRRGVDAVMHVDLVVCVLLDHGHVLDARRIGLVEDP